jgi:hypothetical protein
MLTVQVTKDGDVGRPDPKSVMETRFRFVVE